MNIIYLPTIALLCCLMSFLISVFYLIFWKSQPSKTIAGACVFFAISYACYGFRLVCQLLTSQGLTFLDRFNDIFYVGWVFALWLGVRAYGGARTFHPALGVVPSLLIIWDLIAGGIGIALPWHAIPENITGTVWFGMAGFTMWRLYRDRRNWGLAALAILLWLHGISTASYPVTRATWYAPYGFTIFFLLSLAIGMGMMLVVLIEEKQKLLTEMESRRLAEEALHRQNRLIETFFSQAVTPFFLMDRDYNYIRVNEAWAKNFKMNIEDFPGRSYFITNPNDEAIPSDARHILDEVVRSGKPFQGSARPFEFPNQPERGITYWDWILQPIFKNDGELDFLFFSSLDVTERKKAEDELSKYREHLEELVKERTAELEIAKNKAQQYLDTAGVMLVAIDKNRRVSLINQKGCEVLQGTSAEIIGKDWFENFIPQNQRQKVIRGFEQLMAGDLEPVEYFENSVLTQDGRERLVAWHNVLLRDGEGRITGTLSSGEDITEKRHADKQITSLNQDLRSRALALEAANKELDAFAYTVSHDLRAPLRHIDGFLALLQKEVGTALNEQGRHYMSAISESANKMGLLIDDLLSFSRMRRHAFLFQQVQMEPLVRDVIHELDPDAAGRTIEWRIGDLPSVNGDERMLRIVMTNLITNAMKFTRTRMQARIEIGSLPDQDAESVIFVRDNGVGFDMSYTEKLFGVFQRLHRADDFEGTGIGLASVRRIIARHGGRTWAEGELDKGATFYIALPRELQGGGNERA